MSKRIVLYTLLFAGVFLVTGCPKNKVPEISYTGVLDDWEKTAVTTNNFGEFVKEFTNKARDQSSASMFIVASQMIERDGKLRDAFSLCDKAEAISPDVDGPHFQRGKLIYMLAMYDMAKRGLMDVEIKNLDELNSDQLKSSHIAFESNFILGSKQPLIDDMLSKKGITSDVRMAMSVQIIQFSNSKIAAPKEDLDKFYGKMNSLLGEFKGKLAVARFHPDDQAKFIIKQALKEFELGSTMKKMDVPAQLEVIDYNQIDALSARLRLLAVD